ncbi:glyoxalase/bleomycin resistance protein/dioxygenase superfamily protein [Nocardiopsis sp. Huas11]|uniref:VOC family protein n=1 Tax=Nocardiopsis sp. Huas11 TaxID=2183912 RepID=UPI000EB3B5B0|nr:VOC family protein [Nocardiopsis sp. Huas11]RKS08116.1 glyoxalase/bleomycin resistance protein/dioxygenase superfamily protein [Nocardiopsis sp. Huas11]
MNSTLDLVGIITADLKRSVDFYGLLGIDVPAVNGDEPHVEAVLPNGLRLAWDTVETIRGFDPDFRPSAGPGSVALAFKCHTPQEVDATYRRLTGAGYPGHKAPWDAFWGQRYAVVHDPDGNTVDLFADS